MDDMKLLVTGALGQLGSEVCFEAQQREYEVVATDVSSDSKAVLRGMPYISLDITDPDAVREVIREVHPDGIIHCAAWTAVDTAEAPENKDKVDRINHKGTEYIAGTAAELHAKLIYISTDYVFNGEGNRPWKPDEKDYAPLNYYGQTKLDGELAVSSLCDKFFIVRTSWVFGRNGSNFIRTMLRLGETHPVLRVVSDQIGTPTYTKDLARLLVDMIGTEKYGYYHASNSEAGPGEYISWADFAEEIFRQAKMDTRVERVTTAEYGQSIAVRPYNSRLDKTKLEECGFRPLQYWKSALSEYLNEIGR